MELKHIVLAASLAVGIAPAFAGDQVIDLSSGSASFVGTSPLLTGGDDVLSFTGLASGTYHFALSLSSQFITGLTGDLNGQALTTVGLGNLAFGGLEGTGSGPFVLTLSGTPGKFGAYSGELSVIAVPEPGTLALMLAGLGAAGLIARRRKPV